VLHLSEIIHLGFARKIDIPLSDSVNEKSHQQRRSYISRREKEKELQESIK
jgi:phage anti-repressor protein